MEDLIKKENDIFEILQKFIDVNLEFIIVGGYAVSSFKHRFSVDADIVVKREELGKFEVILKKDGFVQTKSKELENVYLSKFIRYEKNTASIDILVDAIASRQTGASFSYELLLKNSAKRKIIGIEKEVTALVPTREMLLVTKIHSGRLTDFRDIAALAKNYDSELIKKFLFVGDLDVIKQHLKELGKLSQTQNFKDSFKGVFMEKKFDIDFNEVKRLSELEK